jgi:hypothetical protein
MERGPLHHHVDRSERAAWERMQRLGHNGDVPAICSTEGLVVPSAMRSLNTVTVGDYGPPPVHPISMQRMSTGLIDPVVDSGASHHHYDPLMDGWTCLSNVEALAVLVRVDGGHII